MIATYHNHSGTHWKKWEGRTACGAQVVYRGPFVAGQPIDCEACQDLLASWYPDATWRLKSDAPLKIFEIPVATGQSYKATRALITSLRRRQSRWKKLCGFYPKLWLEMDPPAGRPARPRPDPAAPAGAAGGYTPGDTGG